LSGTNTLAYLPMSSVTNKIVLLNWHQVRKFDLNLQSFRDHFVEQEPLSNGMDPGVRHGYPIDGQPSVVDGGQERSLADKYFRISALNL
jgi:hypothetical protein